MSLDALIQQHNIHFRDAQEARDAYDNASLDLFGEKKKDLIDALDRLTETDDALITQLRAAREQDAREAEQKIDMLTKRNNDYLAEIGRLSGEGEQAKIPVEITPTQPTSYSKQWVALLGFVLGVVGTLVVQEIKKRQS